MYVIQAQCFRTIQRAKRETKLLALFRKPCTRLIQCLFAWFGFCRSGIMMIPPWNTKIYKVLAVLLNQLVTIVVLVYI